MRPANTYPTVTSHVTRPDVAWRTARTQTTVPGTGDGLPLPGEAYWPRRSGRLGGKNEGFGDLDGLWLLLGREVIGSFGWI